LGVPVQYTYKLMRLAGKDSAKRVCYYKQEQKHSSSVRAHAVVNSYCWHVLGHKALFAVSFDEAALGMRGSQYHE